MRRVRAIAAGAGAVAVALACAAGLWIAFHVFPESELARKPYPLRRIDVVFPPERDGIEYYGRVRLALVIGRDGVVERVDLLESTLPAGHVAVATRAFGEARWEPGTRWGLPLKSRKVVEISIAAPPGTLTRPGS